MKPRDGAQLWLLPLLLTLVVAGLVFWPMLGYSSLSQSEGHRAITGWQMLDSGQYLLPRLFGHLYLRKPPGMPWAVAIASSLLGQTEFAARSVSALASTLGACLSCLWACRRFGRVPGAVAGAAFSLTPLFWYPGRSAEIEALHNAFCLTSMLAALGLFAAQGKRGIYAAAWICGISTGLMMLTKGPAGIPCTIAACVAGGVVFRTFRATLVNAAFWLMVALPVVMFGGYLYLAAGEFTRLAEPAITEPPSHFLWNPARLGSIFALPLVALAGAMPPGLLYLFALRGSSRDVQANCWAKAVMGTCALALVIYAAAGVSNPRYAMPALTLLPVCCGVFAWRFLEAPSCTARRGRSFVRVSGILMLIMLAGAMGHGAWLEFRREYQTGGRSQGVALADVLPDGATVWAFEMIDQRPELLYYAKKHAAGQGKKLHIRWQPYPAVFERAGAPLLPPSGGYVLLRTDGRPRDQYPPELPEYAKYGLETRLGQVVYSGKVHNFEFGLFKPQ